MSTLRDAALRLHKKNQGKLAVQAKIEVRNAQDLSLAYSPGVAEPCKEIVANESSVYDYTMKGNLVAVVTNGTAVLGLGNIGPQAALPVMEGKAVLFKKFAGIDAFPICLDCTDTEELARTIKALVPTFGGINLEDIAAPACFEIEERLKRECDIPIFHDDQHGTAIVTAAGLINALRIVDKKLEDIKVVVNGAGAAGIAIIKLLLSLGIKDIILCDTRGMIYSDRPDGMNKMKEKIAAITNLKREQGTIRDALVGADVFIGVSAPGVIDAPMIQSMKRDPIIFAMANPDPEMLPEEAKRAGARIVGTGRSDYPNQVNNVLAFPGIFRGALDVRASEINEQMKIAAVYAIANLVVEAERAEEYVIPKAFDPRVAPSVAAAVARAAIETGVARVDVCPDEIKERTKRLSVLS
ncbi:malate dehydrogenase [Ammoniphilus oxalaticus]|uniref:Malate dehydrogenase n=1 Tax=Ammoniphilus oxalaticus TaxID=66863 RepID=A0A419SIJ1_9BACL|nr:malic enzyme-like NAD(P)-binding protein [Ammoniphilus oxalaticus]RKD23777.1 malate dehydrogenase [Ammoniphilus oxalaticus]